MATVDLTVRGAGIFGLSIAWEAVRRGARVRVIDPAGPGGVASGGPVGALAPHAPDGWTAKKAFQFESLLMAAPFWAEIETVSGRASGYGRTGRLQPLADDRAVALARQRATDAAAHWGSAAVWEVVPAASGAGWTPESATGLLIRDTLSARLNPRDAVAALAGALRARGGEVVTDAPDQGAVVWATGWQGLAVLSEALARPVGEGVKGQALVLRAPAPPGAPQLFAGGLHIVPHADGTVAIGSTTERGFLDPAAIDAQVEALHERAIAALPRLRGALVVARWAGVRPRARSGAPLLGHWPGRPGHFIANGGFKIGFGIAPKVAVLMADLVLDGRDAIPEAFRVENSL